MGGPPAAVRELNPRPTVALATLGCKVNQADTEDLAAAFARAGFARVEFGERADVYVVNTCTVTHVADRKSRQLIRQARRLNEGALVVATGCFAEVDPAQVSAVGGVDLVLGNSDKARLVELVCQARPACLSPATQASPATGRTRAFVKIQTGCDNHCTYCIVPRARGASRSEPLEGVLARVAEEVAAGRREVVLTGVHAGAYGRDFGDGTSLAGLLRAILVRTAVERVRLSSLEPEDLTPELLAVWQEGGERLCRHFHLPLQSGSDAVLRRMGRRYRAADFAELVAEVRRALPGVAITVDVMVGFPGESEAEHAESTAFVRHMGFAGAHVFKYSPRPGTPAARLPGRVPAALAKARSDEMLALAQEGAARFRRSFVGGRLRVLFEDEVRQAGEPAWVGLSDNYIRVCVRSAWSLANRLATVRVEREIDEGLAGSLEG